MSLRAPETITSESNSKFKVWKSLLETKGRKKENLFFLCGQKIIQDFVKLKHQREWPVQSILVNSEDYEAWSPIISEILDQAPAHTRTKASVFILSRSLFKELDSLGTHSIILVLHTPKIAAVQLGVNCPPPVGLELVLPITNPSNMGAVLRSAAAFGIRNCFLTQSSCDPFHPKSVRASSGTVLDITFKKLNYDGAKPDTFDRALDMTGTSINQLRWPDHCRLWLGEEGQGTLIKFPDSQKITIPIASVESLNVAIAGSIALFHWKSNLGHTSL